jgi:hypothetical protein
VADDRPYQPHPIDLVQELRRTVGLFDGAMPITPKKAWEEAIEEVWRLKERADARR